MTRQSTSITQATPSSSRQRETGRMADDCSGRQHYGYANSSARASVTPPPVLRASLVRAIGCEIRNCLWRIGEIRRRALDRQGISIDPLREIPLPPEQQANALARCIRDTQNLYKSRRITTLIEAELFAQGWQCGAAWSIHNSRTEPPA
jgi:hypothetical protein